MRTQIYFSAGFSMFLCAASLAHANDDSIVSVVTGIDYYAAGYTRNGNERAIIIPGIIKYNDGNRLSAELYVPYLRYTAPQNVLPGLGAISSNSNVVTTRDGIGDTKAGITYAIFTKPWTELTGIVKLPTASTEKGLGTGKTDYTIQIATYPATAMKQLKPYFWGGYKVYGNPPGQSLNNTLFASAGADYKFSDINSLGLGFDYQQARIDSQLPDRLLNVHFAHAFSKSAKLAVELQKSILSSTTSWTFATTLRYQFDVKKPKT